MFIVVNSGLLGGDGGLESWPLLASKKNQLWPWVEIWKPGLAPFLEALVGKQEIPLYEILNTSLNENVQSFIHQMAPQSRGYRHRIFSAQRIG